ncbi:MAG: aspartate ammonia-lyase [Mesorhizobium sp.]|uniref:aspartate ammonia-lyase n=1 Tax=unclassified Mesorhizobium TaxID=325217 RepID=UPI000BAED526|nr:MULTISPECIES: aspartate ammonia-lyase [unclassified Mesorhizobium]PBB28911.1 aspartate ammonia-lyase [Mesorhizobium sp. WSM3882]PBB43713.1 aspartate ammonia-lyase [Mesorhizobium sp. WSM3866]RWG59667.1 MAG: aspartate ammonia-lyase [Mesorhizobium sp.]RWH46710.1 MAG: aspartate ammonia-lyase [Mesorhizobium sp.]TIM70752.1 MAG: aspartate ammonia-lyase [Mesorhizobium sp.]
MIADRIETDLIGPLAVPGHVLYGVHTRRAEQNFDVSGLRLKDFPEFIQSMAMVKKAACLANMELGLLSPEKAQAISDACGDIIELKGIEENFPVDMMQGGAGTSTNMNVNEVVTNLALIKLGAKIGDYARLHPNDDVNLSQSTNDVYPTAIRLTVLRACDGLVSAQVNLRDAFRAKALQHANELKVGRTQLQDAVPMTVGQEFGAFAELIDEDIVQLQSVARLLLEINLGGSAIGTSINVPREFPGIVCGHLSRISGIQLVAARNFIEATSDTGGFVSFSGMLKRIAVKLTKICNDLRLLSSGPLGGLGEIRLPPVQAGSSIMPGKINPVIPEMVNQLSFQVIGHDLTVTLAASAGQLQLNAMEPVIVLNILQSMRLLTRGMRIFKERCVDGIEVDFDRCRALLDQSLVLATPLAKLIGYGKAAELSKRALAGKRTLRQVVEEAGVLLPDQVEHIFGNSAEFAGLPDASPA